MIRSSFQQFAKIIKILNFGNLKKRIFNADTYIVIINFDRGASVVRKVIKN